MGVVEKIPRQEMILAALAYDKKHGGEIAKVVEHGHFDRFHREFARRLIDYRRNHEQPPSQQILEDLAERGCIGKEKQETARAIIDGLKRQCAIDAEYVSERAFDFINRQQLMTNLYEANERFERGGDDMVSDVTTILTKAISTPQRSKEDNIMSADAFMQLRLQEPELLLPPWLEAESTTMLHGPPGSRKTLALMETALGLATAQPCFAGRWTPSRPVRVLYVDGELSPGQFKRRWRRFPLIEACGPNLKLLSRRYARSQGTTWPSFYTREGQAMLDRAVAVHRPEVIILDSIFTLFGAMSEKEVDAWTQVADWLAKHQDEGRAFILVHHDAKGTTRNAWGTVMRSVRIDNQISFGPVTDEETDEEAIEVRFLKHRESSAQDVKPFLFFSDLVGDYWGFRWKPVSSQKTNQRQREADDRRRTILQMADEGYTPGKIADAVGLSARRVRDVIRNDKQAPANTRQEEAALQ